MPLPPKNPPQPLPNNQTTPRATVPPAGMMPGRAPLQPNMRPGQPMRSGQPMRPGQPVRSGQPVQRPMQPQAGQPQNNMAYAPQNTQQPQQNNAPQSRQTAQNQPTQNFASEFNLPPAVVSTKGFLLITAIALMVGFFFGSMMGAGTATNRRIKRRCVK